MTMRGLIRRVAVLGLVVAAEVPLEAGARGQAIPVVPQAGIGPAMPGGGIGPAMPGRPAPAPFISPPISVQLRNGTVPNGLGGVGAGGLGVGGLGGFGGGGYGGFGYGGFGYPGMYGGFGGLYGGAGMSLPPTPEFGDGAYRAGNSFPSRAAGPGMGAGGPADPNAPRARNSGPNAAGEPSLDPFDAAGAADRAPGRATRSKRAHTGRRPAARKPAPTPTGKPRAGDSQARPDRPEVEKVRDEAPAASQEKPADAAGVERAKPAARRQSTLGSPR